MAKIRTLIVDDEPLAREGVRMLLEGDSGIEIVGECVDGREAVARIGAQAPDLIFLDVQMPEMSGFEVIEAINADAMPLVIFVTAFDKYALDAFDAHAVDYLLKPFTRQRFFRALARAKDQIRRNQSSEVKQQMRALLEDLRGQSNYLERLVVRSGGSIYFLSVEEIDWIEAAENYVRLHRGKEMHLVHGTMNGLESSLDPTTFLRIHRSTIVNLKRIQQLQPLSHGEYIVILRDQTRLTSGRSYRTRLESLLRNAF